MTFTKIWCLETVEALSCMNFWNCHKGLRDNLSKDILFVI